MIDERLAALDGSARRLRRIVEGLDPGQLTASAYPTEWTIADVLSHIGSGAVILRQSLEDGVAGRESDGGFAPSVWDEWNAKTPEAQAADALTADRALIDRLQSLNDGRAERFSFSLGPMTVDLAGFVGLRLSEHVVHTWDVEVALDPGATLPLDATEQLIDNLGMIVRFTGKPTGDEHTVHIATRGPERRLALSFGTEAVSLEPDPDGHPADLEIPAEAFVRLVYGRLDPVPPRSIEEPDLLDDLRRAFPGI